MKVVHCKKEPYDIYIGRSTDPIIGKWGNPYSHLDNTQAKFKTNDRAQAINKYEEYITAGNGVGLLKDLHELDGKVLGCWCKPKSCHGDVLLKLVKKNKTKLF